MEQKIEVVKVTTPDGEEYYTLAESFDVRKFVGDNKIEYLYMTEEDYMKIPASLEAVEFFGG